MAEAIRIQDALVAKLGHEVAGWKLGASSRAAMAAAGIEGPMSGRLFRHILHEDGARFPAKSFRAPILEAEFAFRMAADLPAREAAYGEGEVLDAVAEMIMGVEVADNRYAATPPIPMPFLTADNAATGAYVVGGSVADWREMDSTTIEATLEVDGEVVGAIALRRGAL